MVPLDLINASIYQSITATAITGVTTGITGVTLIVMFMLVDRQKLRSPLFLINSCGLFLEFLDSVIDLVGFNSIQEYGLGQFGLGGVAQYSPTSLWWSHTFEAVANILVVGCILASLVLQVHAVFVAQPRIQKYITIVLSIAAIGSFVLALTWEVLYTRCVWTEMGCHTDTGRPPYDNIYIGAESILEGILGIACIVLIGKLFLSIRFRRQAGIRRFGVLHILLIAFGQCLVIPRISIFCISKL